MSWTTWLSVLSTIIQIGILLAVGLVVAIAIRSLWGGLVKKNQEAVQPAQVAVAAEQPRQRRIERPRTTGPSPVVAAEHPQALPPIEAPQPRRRADPATLVASAVASARRAAGVDLRQFGAAQAVPPVNPASSRVRPQKRAPDTMTAPPPAQKLEVYTGKLLYARVEDRAGKGYSAFCVAIADEARGNACNQLWGADLERAVKDAGAQPGDRIEVSLAGSSRVPIRQTGADGQEGIVMSHKKLWNIVVLES